MVYRFAFTIYKFIKWQAMKAFQLITVEVRNKQKEEEMYTFFQIKSP